jgi:hypothetical protein
VLAYQADPQFPDLPTGVAGVRLAEIFWVPGQRAGEEVDPAEVQPFCLLSIPQLM